MSSNETIKKHLKIMGRVQGVGFRYFTKQNAKDLGICGWVKNMPDGSVEAVITGSAEQVEQMVERLRSGPVAAKVEEIKELFSGLEKENFNVFNVRR
jgi:acylphosphatase